MQHLDLQVVRQALKWPAAGQRVWLCTVLFTYGSAPRAPGSLLAVNQGGQWVGSLSGGCVEDDFLERVAAGEFAEPVKVVRYGEGDERSNIRLQQRSGTASTTGCWPMFPKDALGNPPADCSRRPTKVTSRLLGRAVRGRRVTPGLRQRCCRITLRLPGRQILLKLGRNADDYARVYDRVRDVDSFRPKFPQDDVAQRVGADPADPSRPVSEPADADGDVAFRTGDREQHPVPAAERTDFVGGQHPHRLAERHEFRGKRKRAHTGRPSRASRTAATT